MRKGSKHVSKKGTTSPVAIVAKGTTSKHVEGRVTRPIGKIVDVVPPDQLQREIKSLLGDLSNATTRNAKKGIRRALRTRGHYVSRDGGGLSTRVASNVVA